MKQLLPLLLTLVTLSASAQSPEAIKTVQRIDSAAEDPRGFMSLSGGAIASDHFYLRHPIPGTTENQIITTGGGDKFEATLGKDLSEAGADTVIQRWTRALEPVTSRYSTNITGYIVGYQPSALVCMRQIFQYTNVFVLMAIIKERDLKTNRFRVRLYFHLHSTG